MGFVAGGRWLDVICVVISIAACASGAATLDAAGQREVENRVNYMRCQHEAQDVEYDSQLAAKVLGFAKAINSGEYGATDPAVLLDQGMVGEVRDISSGPLPVNLAAAVTSMLIRTKEHISNYNFSTQSLNTGLTDLQEEQTHQAMRILWKEADRFGCQMVEYPQTTAEYATVCWFATVRDTTRESIEGNIADVSPNTAGCYSRIATEAPPTAAPTAVPTAQPTASPATPIPPTEAPATYPPPVPETILQEYTWLSLGLKMHTATPLPGPAEIPEYARRLADNLRRSWAGRLPPAPFSLAVVMLCDLLDGKKPVGRDAERLCHAVSPAASNTTTSRAAATLQGEGGVFAEVLLRDATFPKLQHDSEVLHTAIGGAAGGFPPLADPARPADVINPIAFSVNVYLAPVQQGSPGSSWELSASAGWSEVVGATDAPPSGGAAIPLWAWAAAGGVALIALAGVVFLLAIKRPQQMQQKGATVSVSDFYKAMPAPIRVTIPEEHYCMEEVASSASSRSQSQRDLSSGFGLVIPMGRI